MNDDRIVELLIEIRDELRESRERTLKRYDEVLIAQAKTDAGIRERWEAETDRFNRWWVTRSMFVIVVMAATILTLAFMR